MSPTTKIHPTTIIHPSAEIGEGVEIGAYSVIGEHVRIGDRTSIGHHTVIEGWTAVGQGNRISHFVSIGAPPQDIKYKGEETRVEIGNENLIREYVTINRATPQGRGVTSIGNGCFIMIMCHIAHDCLLGNGVIMANLVGLSGHCLVEDDAVFGGMAGVHQYVRIGSLAMIAGGARVGRDVPPYTLAAGDRAKLFGMNSIGLRRKKIPPQTIEQIKQVYRTIFRSGLNKKDAIEKAKKEAGPAPEVQHFLSFMEGTKRGFCPSSSSEEEWED